MLKCIHKSPAMNLVSLVGWLYLLAVALLLCLLTVTKVHSAVPDPPRPFVPDPPRCVQDPPAKKFSAVSYRSPVGHTHTCPLCGNTWDHQANASHHCNTPGCPGVQYVQDSRARPVRIVTPVSTTAAVEVDFITPLSGSASSSGCTSGQCNSSSSSSRGLFGRRR